MQAIASSRLQPRQAYWNNGTRRIYAMHDDAMVEQWRERARAIGEGSDSDERGGGAGFSA